MILSGKEIVKHLGKEIIITPFHPERVNPNSYNLSLYNQLMVYDDYELDMAKPNPASSIDIPEDG
uniref:dCTP deaminase domain-containing protein n=1 Tax=Megasphaera stantonii TaxID=2144175 RepID=UPI0039C2A3F1